jgi:hypothetical protein
MRLGAPARERGPMSDDLTFWTLPDAAIAALPELRSEIRANVDRYIEVLGKQPYPHVVLEEHLLPLVVRADRDGDEDALRRCFELLERIASHADEDLVGALGHAFLTPLDKSILERRAELVGPMLRDLATRWPKAASTDESE